MGPGSHDRWAPVERVISLLLVLWVALLGADRINLLAGSASFLLTPFLILTPLVLLLETTRLALTRDALRVPPRAPHYVALAGILLSLVTASALLGGDPALSSKRTVLLMAQVLGTLLGGLVLLNRRDPERILVRGAYLGLILSLFFNVGQVYYWITGQWDVSQEESELIINLAPRTYGSVLPRLSGTAVDQGQGGLLFVLFVFLLFRFAPRSRRRNAMIALGVIFLLGTLARAAILCAIIAGVVLWMQRRRIRVSRLQVVTVSLAVAAVSLLILIRPPWVEAVLTYLEPLANRFSTREGSARLHVLLIERGFYVATSSVRNALLGIGYGNGLAVLQDFFPGNKYANFHSLYITLLAESGVFALAVGCLMLAYPLFAGGVFAPLIAGFMAYNLFYQANAEPAFWFILAMAWLSAGAQRLTRPLPGSLRPLTAGRPTLAAVVLGAGLLSSCSSLLSDGYDYGRIEVEVVRRSGEPVPGVDLVLYNWERHMAYGTTGAAGRYVFEFVPEGEFGVRAVPDGGYLPLDYDIPSVFLDGVEVQKGGRAAVSFTLLKVGPGAVEVVVRHLTGEPIEGIPVEIYSYRGTFAKAKTDAAGRFVFQEVPFGSYGVRAIPPKGFVPSVGESYLDGLIVDEGSRDTVSFALERCLGTVRVRVVDDRGRPAHDVGLSLYEYRGEIARGETGADGAHQFREVPCGNYGVAIIPTPGFVPTPGRGGSYVDDLEIDPRTELAVAFTVTACTGRMRVRVVDSEGQPVSGAVVTLYSFRGEISSTTTGADGALELEAPCGDLGVKVSPPSGYSVPEGRGSSFFDGLQISEGGERAVSFVLRRS